MGDIFLSVPRTCKYCKHWDFRVSNTEIEFGVCENKDVIDKIKIMHPGALFRFAFGTDDKSENTVDLMFESNFGCEFFEKFE
jgi:hypothetical protein